MATGVSLPATGSLTVNGGTFELNGNNLTVASLSGMGGNLALGAGTLTVDDTSGGSSGALDAPITGAGALVKQGSGTLVLAASNTYTGGTTIAGGTLQIGAGGTSGSVPGDIANNGNLALNRSDVATFANTVSGSGSLTQAGPGTTILTADNNYTGGTTITQGTLQIGNGGTTGSITGNISNNGNLALNRADTVTFANTVSGAGSLTQAGSGTTILAASNSYSGGMLNGTLRLAASTLAQRLWPSMAARSIKRNP